MNSQELHERGLVDDATAIRIALISDGWSEDLAAALVLDFANSCAVERPQTWQRWYPAELAMLDAVIAEAGGKLPGVAVTRPLALTLSRSHKSVVSAIERRIADPPKQEEPSADQ